MTTILFTPLSYELLEQVKISGSTILVDQAYGAQAIREYILELGASYVIPPQENVYQPWPIDWHLFKERHLIEWFFQKIKGFSERRYQI